MSIDAIRRRKLNLNRFDRKVATAQLDKVADSLSESNNVFLQSLKLKANNKKYQKSKKKKKKLAEGIRVLGFFKGAMTKMLKEWSKQRSFTHASLMEENRVKVLSVNY